MLQRWQNVNSGVGVRSSIFLAKSNPSLLQNHFDLCSVSLVQISIVNVICKGTYRWLHLIVSSYYFVEFYGTKCVREFCHYFVGCYSCHCLQENQANFALSWSCFSLPGMQSGGLSWVQWINSRPVTLMHTNNLRILLHAVNTTKNGKWTLEVQAGIPVASKLVGKSQPNTLSGFNRASWSAVQHSLTGF